jgi:pyruvate formate lyase activating enzyme
MWFEYMMAIARLIHENKLKNVMVSNGYISEEPLVDLLSVIDAFNIDLKGFTQEFYRTFTGSALEPVLNTLKKIRTAGRHLEVTCLIIPGQNDNTDDFNRMISWIADELGPATIFHLSRYHPAYKLGLEATPADSIENMLEIARKKLSYVYAGNIQIKDYQDTKCHNCHKIVIKRVGYYTGKIAVTDTGLCQHCGSPVVIC